MADDKVAQPANNRSRHLPKSIAGRVDKIKLLREKTFAGVMDCKKALVEASGNLEKAVEILRKKGIALAGKKATRIAKEGVIASYIHTNHKIGVLVEVNCESDFVARNELFKNFVKDITMQIAASCPQYIDKEDVPKKIVDKEIDPDKFYKDTCLLYQPFIKDPEITIKDLLISTIAKLGENIVIRRFTRYQLGEEI